MPRVGRWLAGLALFGLAVALTGPTPMASAGHVLSMGPAARDNMGMADDAARGRVVLFGGYEFGSFVADTWTWDGTAWTEQHPTHSPIGRCCMAMAYDAARRLVVLFGGGYAYGSLGDTW